MSDNTNLNPGDAKPDLNLPPKEADNSPKVRYYHRLRERASNAPTTGPKYWLFLVLTLLGSSYVPQPSMNERLERTESSCKQWSNRFPIFRFGMFNLKGGAAKTMTLLIVLSFIVERLKRWLIALDFNDEAGNLAGRTGTHANQTMGLRRAVKLFKSGLTTNEFLDACAPTLDGLRVIRGDDPREGGSEITGDDAAAMIEAVMEHCEVMGFDSPNKLSQPLIREAVERMDVVVFTAKAYGDDQLTMMHIGKTMNILRSWTPRTDELVNNAIIAIVGAKKIWTYDAWWKFWTYRRVYPDYRWCIDEREEDGTLVMSDMVEVHQFDEDGNVITEAVEELDEDGNVITEAVEELDDNGNVVGEREIPVTIEVPVKVEVSQFKGQIIHLPRDPFISSGKAMLLAALRKRTQLAFMRLTEAMYVQANRLRSLRGRHSTDGSIKQADNDNPSGIERELEDVTDVVEEVASPPPAPPMESTSRQGDRPQPPPPATPPGYNSHANGNGTHSTPRGAKSPSPRPRSVPAARTAPPN